MTWRGAGTAVVLMDGRARQAEAEFTAQVLHPHVHATCVSGAVLRAWQKECEVSRPDPAGLAAAADLCVGWLPQRAVRTGRRWCPRAGAVARASLPVRVRGC